VTFSNRIIGRRGVAPAGAGGAPHNPNDSASRYRVMGSGAGHRRPAVRIAAPTGRVRRRGCAPPVLDRAGCPTEEECALRSLGATPAWCPVLAEGGAAAPRVVDARERSFWSTEARWGAGGDAAGRGHTGSNRCPGRDRATKGESPCRQGTVGPWTMAKRVRARRRTSIARPRTSIARPSGLSAMASTEQEEFPDDGGPSAASSDASGDAGADSQ
jgi:hypothetical protein